MKRESDRKSPEVLKSRTCPVVWPLWKARGRDSWCWPKGARPLGTRMLAPRDTTFYDIFARACAEIKISRKWLTSSRFSVFLFFIFLRLSFFSFSYIFAAVIFFLLSLLPVQKSLKKHHRDGQILPFSLRFLSIFVHISGSNEPITDLGIIGKIFSSCRTWVHMIHFGQRWWRQKCNKGQRSSRPAQESMAKGMFIFIDVAIAAACHFWWPKDQGF